MVLNESLLVSYTVLRGSVLKKTKHTSGRILYSLRIIPDRGSWLEVQFDINDFIYIYLDRRRRRRKFLISTFLKAVGYESTKELLDIIYGIKALEVNKLANLEADDLGQIYHAETVLGSEGNPILDHNENKIAQELEPLSEETLHLLNKEGVTKINVVETADLGYSFIKCLQEDPCNNQEEALKEIYRRMPAGRSA